MKIIFLIELFVIFPIMAYSSDWKCIYHVPSVTSYTDPKTGEPVTVYPKNAGECQRKIDFSNLKYLPNGHVRVWESTKLGHGDKGFSWRTDLYELDCVNNKWKYLQVGFDSLANEMPPEGPSPWFWIEPDSPEKNLSEAVCKHKK
jgi:hypothetical protein